MLECRIIPEHQRRANNYTPQSVTCNRNRWNTAKFFLCGYFYTHTKATKISAKRENHIPISLMYIDAKLLNKLLASWIPEHIKIVTIHHDQLSLIPETQEWINIWDSISIIHHIYKLKGIKHMIISLNAEKAFDKIQHPL